MAIFPLFQDDSFLSGSQRKGIKKKSLRKFHDPGKGQFFHNFSILGKYVAQNLQKKQTKCFLLASQSKYMNKKSLRNFLRGLRHLKPLKMAILFLYFSIISKQVEQNLPKNANKTFPSRISKQIYEQEKLMNILQGSKTHKTLKMAIFSIIFFILSKQVAKNLPKMHRKSFFQDPKENVS